MTKKSRKRPPKDSDTYRPGLNKEEKARNHRQAQKAYYASNPMARENHRARAAASRQKKKALARLADELYIQRRLLTPSWANIELPTRSEMHTEPVADCHTVYSAASRQSIAAGERIAIDALVTLRQPQHIAEEWPRPASDSILERAMGLTSSRASSPPASLRPAARNAADAGAGEAGAAVRQALEAVARLNRDHPLRRSWANASAHDYYRTFWTRDDHRKFLGQFLPLDAYVGVRRWRIHTYNCTTRAVQEHRAEEFWPDVVTAWMHDWGTLDPDQGGEAFRDELEQVSSSS
ncbi:hypothetical protein B0H16DRAFT_1715935 [Mycena metata]|uniref:Uncharacterized protein n=1 Tax=Mycena metata TaxID=1033252 RepID=A0AAD7JSS0_9AGAR|nr:hypothetical protein B0H16DRAFT_1715935 [Mycena metata]